MGYLVSEQLYRSVGHVPTRCWKACLTEHVYRVKTLSSAKFQFTRICRTYIYNISYYTCYAVTLYIHLHSLICILFNVILAIWSDMWIIKSTSATVNLTTFLTFWWEENCERGYLPRCQYYWLGQICNILKDDSRIEAPQTHHTSWFSGRNACKWYDSKVIWWNYRC
jgi:hypothetical protein